MMDDFLEQVAGRRHQALYTLLYFVMWFFIVVFGLFGVTLFMRTISQTPEGGIQFNFIPMVVGAALAGIAFLLWRRCDYCRVEYEYSFTNGNLDISQVLNNKRRRYLTALEMKEVIKGGPVQSPAFQKVLAEPGIKKHNWFVNRDAKLYFFYFEKHNVKHVAVCELTDEMVALIRSKNTYIQSGVWVDENGKTEFKYGISR